MQETKPMQPVLFVALVVLIASDLVFLLLRVDIPIGLGLGVLLGALGYGATYFALKRTLYRQIENVNRMLLDSIKNERFKNRMEATDTNALSKLENAIKRLIREKTVEIDNLKELERLRKEFLGDVAHELRSPIFNIQGYIHTLIEGAWKDEAVSQRFLDKAAKHVDHLSSLVEDLVTITRIEAGEIKLELADFDIKELIHEVCDLLDLPAKQKQITLTLKFSLDTPIMVNADRAKIRQVLVNLIGNSIKYGKMTGNTSVSLQDDPAYNRVTVSISDNGEGIAEEHLPRIFERFYRVDKSRNRTEPSTGLGLAIVKHFIEAHKQTIDVTSREGVGSIFSFTLQRV